MKALRIAATLLIAIPLAAQEIVKLPAPRTGGGMPLMQALKNRHSARAYSSKPLSQQLLGDLLWAAFGVNRPETGGRTAPSAYNSQEIDLFVFTGEGVYLYEANRHALRRVKAGDNRSYLGSEPYATTAPVNLAYIADHARSEKTLLWDKERMAYADTGFIGQNVYLFCASEGLATVIHDNTDKGALARRLGLRRDQQIILTQAVGYPR